MINFPDVQQKVLDLAPWHLSLADVRRRCGGKGYNTLGILFGNKVFLVSPEFGWVIQTLVFAGRIRLDRDRRRRICVYPGRTYEQGVVNSKRAS